MPHIIAPALIDAIWKALGKPVPRLDLVDDANRVRTIAAGLWVECYDVGKLVEDWDGRLRGIDITRFAQALGYPTPTVFKSVGRKSQCTWSGYKMIQRADAAAIMTDIERLGFRVDPTAMVEAVLPSVVDLPIATEGEVAVIDFYRLRHRAQAITLIRRGSQSQRGSVRKKLRTPGGYKVTAEFDNGILVRVVVGPPKFRRPTEPQALWAGSDGLSRSQDSRT